MCWLMKAWSPLVRHTVLLSRPRSPGSAAAAAGGRSARDEAAGAPQETGFARGAAHHGIVAAQVDIAVVDEEAIGDAGETVEGLIVVDGDRLLAQVAAGHHHAVKPWRRRR